MWLDLVKCEKLNIQINSKLGFISIVREEHPFQAYFFFFFFWETNTHTHKEEGKEF